MPQLDPTWFASQIFWLIVSFTLLYGLLARVILPPLINTIGQRGATISGDIAAAEEARNLALRARQDYDQTLSQSREMAQGLISEVMEENKEHAEAALRAMDVEISKKLDEAATRIRTRKLDLLSVLTPTAAEFAAMIAEKITLKSVHPDHASRMVMERLKTKGPA